MKVNWRKIFFFPRPKFLNREQVNLFCSQRVLSHQTVGINITKIKSTELQNFYVRRAVPYRGIRRKSLETEGKVSKTSLKCLQFVVLRQSVVSKTRKKYRTSELLCSASRAVSRHSTQKP